MILHEHTLIAHALAHYLSQQSGVLVVGAATDAQTAIETAKAEAPDLALLHIECLLREGPRIDEVLGRYQIPSVLLASRDDARVRDLGIDSERIIWLEAHLSALTTAARQLATIPLSRDDRRAHPSASRHVSPREAAVIQLVAEGRSSKEISEELGVCVRTVDNHRGRVMRRLGVRSGYELIRLAIRNGIIEP